MNTRVSGQAAWEGFDDSHQTPGEYSLNDENHAQGEPQLSPIEDYAFYTISHPGASSTRLRDINNAGEIVGWLYERGTYHGYYSFIVSEGVLQKIGNPGDCNLFAWDINDAGEITGTYYDWDPNRYYGFMLKDGALDLFLIPGSTHTEAKGINNAGQIVGEWPAYLYSDGEFVIWSFADAFLRYQRRGRANRWL